MKQIFLLVSLAVCMDIYATIRTVSNHPATLAQFSTIQAAVDASSNGDTIYVHGSPTQYASFTVTNKRLVIMGPGWSPDKAFMPFKATVGGMTLSGAGSDSSEIHGLVFAAAVGATGNPPKKLRFYRNHFKAQIHLTTSLATYTGYVFQGNVFDGAQVIAATSSNYVDFVFRNNVFYDYSGGTGNFYGFTNSVNVLLDHNLWYGAGTTNCFSGDCRFLLITNNIFVRRNAANNNSFSTFNNNITFNAGTNNPWSVNGNSNAGGNIENQDPQMADQAAVNTGTNNPLLNFTIAAGPANNSGSDGKDMGLLFDASGSLNWANSRTSRLPFVYNMNITNPTLPAGGGTLNVQVEARKGN